MQAIPARCSARADGDAKARRHTRLDPRGSHTRLYSRGSYARFDTCGSYARFDPRGSDASFGPGGIDPCGGNPGGIDSRGKRNAGCARGRFRKPRTKGPCCDCRWR